MPEIEDALAAVRSEAGDEDERRDVRVPEAALLMTEPP